MNKEMHGMLIWAPLLNHRQRAGCVSISTILKDRKKKALLLLLTAQSVAFTQFSFFLVSEKFVYKCQRTMVTG
jgi:hypothetical protein